MTIPKKIESYLVIATENGAVKRVVSPTDMQIGYAGKPAELSLNGRFSQSIATVEVEPGKSTTLSNDVSVLLVSRKGSNSGNITVNMPSGTRTGQTCYVKDGSGTAATNNVVVASPSLIDGSKTKTIKKAYGSLILAWSGKTWVLLNELPEEAPGPTGKSYMTLQFSVTDSLTKDTVYLVPGSNGTYLQSTALGTNYVVLPSNCKVSNMYVTQTAGDPGATVTYEVKKITLPSTATSTGLSVTLSYDQTAGSNTTNTVSFSSGELLAVSTTFLTTGSPTEPSYPSLSILVELL